MQPAGDDQGEWKINHRPLRWYEWLLVLMVLALAGGVRAAPVYKCTGGDGAVAYQQLPCAADQQARTMTFGAAPPIQPSPHYAAEPVRDETPAHEMRETHRGGRASAEPMAYECRAADGEVFYRHTPCPHSIAAGTQTARNSRRGGFHSGSGTVTVSSRRVTREEACRQIHSAGAISRAGHEHDEDVSTYERNLGRDPCR